LVDISSLGPYIKDEVNEFPLKRRLRNGKTMRKLLLIILILIPSLCSADIHYVSEIRTSEYRCSSPDTGADSIMQAVRVTNPENSVIVTVDGSYPGVTIMVEDTVNLIQKMDSSLIYDIGSVTMATSKATNSILRECHKTDVEVKQGFVDLRRRAVKQVWNNRTTTCYSVTTFGHIQVIIENCTTTV